MTVLFLIRHASNDFVKEGRLAGWTRDLHINGQGQREADELARRVAHVPFEAIYSSPLDRALDTANAVAECHHLPVQIREGLGETRIGEWTGKLIKELQDTDTWKDIQKNPVGVHPPGGGESIDEVQKRMAAAVEAIRRDHKDAVVAIVSHADPLKALVAHYLCWDLNYFQRISINPASVTILVVDDENAHLMLLNHHGDIPRFEKPKAKKPEAAVSESEQPAASSEEASGKDERKMTDANLLYDLNPVTRINTGAVGEPGHRVFYLQGRQGTTLVTLQAEKEQINSLSSGIEELLDKLGEKREEPASPYDAMLEEPLEPLFRIGQLGLGYDQENQLLVVVAYEATTEESPEAVNVVRFWATRGQMRGLAEQAATSVAGGRPICVLCGKPIDPEGHFCPRRNGHGARATLT